jgi:hypothetical protein
MSTNPFAGAAAALGFTGEEKPTDYWGNYEASSSKRSQAPLQPGRYTFKVPEPGDDFQPAKQANGYPAYKMNPTVSRGDRTGYQVRFVYLSSMPFSNRNGSMAGDLVKACGLNASPTKPQDWFDIAPYLAGKEFDAVVDLEVYDKESRETIFKKAADIPTRADGSLRMVLVLRPDGTIADEGKDEEDALANGGRKVFANNKIRAIYPVE